MPEKENPAPGATGDGAGIGQCQHVVNKPPNSKAQRWRARFAELGIAVHPAAECFPEVAEEELSELANDIVENGLRQPITLYCDRIKRSPNDYPRQDELILLDGRTRLSAM